MEIENSYNSIKRNGKRKQADKMNFYESTTL